MNDETDADSGSGGSDDDDNGSTDSDGASDPDGDEVEEEVVVADAYGVTETAVQQLMAAFYAPSDLPDEDDVIGDPDYYPDVKRRRAATQASVKAGLVVSPGPYQAATGDPADRPSPLWQLPDEVWVRIFQLGWCFLPMGLIRQVCRRFYALACAVAGHVPPNDRMHWCYHCLRTNYVYFVEARRYTGRTPSYLCTDCERLPMHNVMGHTALMFRFSLARADIRGRADYRRTFWHSSDHRRMYFYTTAMKILANKCGQPYADATRALDEWRLLPFPKPAYVTERELEHTQRQAFLHGQAAVAAEKQKALKERRALGAFVTKLLKQRGLQTLRRRHPALLKAVRGDFSRDQIVLVVDRMERFTALEAAFRQAGVVAGGLTMDLADPQEDLAQARRAGECAGCWPFRRLEGYELLGRQFVHFGTMNGEPTTAAAIAAIAREQVAREREAEELINAAMPVGSNLPMYYYRRKRWADFPHPHPIFVARTRYVLHGDNLDELRQLANEEAAKEAEHLRELVAKYEVEKRQQEKARQEELARRLAERERQRAGQERRRAERTAAADPYANIPGRLEQLALADVPMRWVTIGERRVPEADDADHWLSYFLSATERSQWIAQGRPLSRRERYTALVNFGRTSVTDQYKLSALPMLVRRFLKPGSICSTYRGPLPPPPVETSAAAHAVAPAAAHDAASGATSAAAHDVASAEANTTASAGPTAETPAGSGQSV